MSNYLKKNLFALLIFTMPYMNYALKAMDFEEDKAEKIPIHKKGKAFISIEKTHREPITTYRKDQACNSFPSCCRLCSSDEPPQRGDTVRCVTTYTEPTGFERKLGGVVNPEEDCCSQKFEIIVDHSRYYRCSYEAVYDSDRNLRVIKPHSGFCWEDESYWYRSFCCIISCGSYVNPICCKPHNNGEEITNEEYAENCYHCCVW